MQYLAPLLFMLPIFQIDSAVSMPLSIVRTLCVCVCVCVWCVCVQADSDLNVDWSHNVWRMNKKSKEPVLTDNSSLHNKQLL